MCIRDSLQGDQTLCGKELECAGFVCGIVRYGNGGTIRQSGEGIYSAAIDGERLIVNLCNGYEVGLVFLIEGIEVRLMLEVVCVYLTVLRELVRRYVIGHDLDVQRVALFFEKRLAYL